MLSVQRPLTEVYNAMQCRQAGNPANSTVVLQSETNPASKPPKDGAASPTSQGFSDLVDESVFDMADMDGNSTDFEIGSFDLTDGQLSTARRPFPQPDGNAPR